MCCNQTSMNANIPPSSYHQAAATAASPQQIPISIPNSQSFDAATNEIRDDSHTFNLYIFLFQSPLYLMYDNWNSD
ncbi:hypothetical protein DERF_005467 [Dermatophagoides farinae]|uniref:Uncharacterized protein n=1 Tax=Dermatophagoides farinae TaxID=6954 RepID=A0A922L766_DERFA|nr:hypothetical protein DERF_005467 [Dermatophagoides farinae]